MNATDRYLELLKKSVLEELYFDNEIRLIYLRQCLEGLDTFDTDVLLDIAHGRPELHQLHLAASLDGSSAGRGPQDIGFYHTMLGAVVGSTTCTSALTRSEATASPAI